MKPRPFIPFRVFGALWPGGGPVVLVILGLMALGYLAGQG